MKAALVHYWLVRQRGGEQVLDAIAELLPGADLISHVVDPALLRGALDTVVHERTGLLYQDPSAEGLMTAMKTFESELDAFRPEACVAQALKFSRQRFLAEFAEILSQHRVQLTH